MFLVNLFPLQTAEGKMVATFSWKWSPMRGSNNTFSTIVVVSKLGDSHPKKCKMH